MLIAIITITIILLLVFLPYLSLESSFLRDIYVYLVSDKGTNKEYFEVVLSAITILTTFLMFYLQRNRERKIKIIEDKNREKEQKNLYFEQREKSYAEVRPLFIVQKRQGIGEIELFMRGKEPILNIKIYLKLINSVTDSLSPVIVDSATKGDKLLSFDLGDTEMIVISCKTFLEESIYFVYFIGDSTFHYRLIQTWGDFEYSRQNTGRHFLSDITKQEYDKDFEIYKSHVKYDYLYNLPQLKFSKMLHLDLFKDYLYSDTSQNYNLRLVMALEQDNVELIISESIRFVRELTIIDANLTSTFIGVLIEYLSSPWYITSENIGDDKYYFTSKVVFNDQLLQKQYEEIFRNTNVTADVMIEYMSELQNDIKKYGNVNEYFLRVLEVYFRNHTKISESMEGYTNEIEQVLTTIRNSLKQVLLQYSSKE